MDKVITVKTDAKTKREAQVLAKELGLTLSSLVNSYLKQVVVTRRVELYAPEPVTAKLEEAIKQADKNRLSGRISPGFDNLDDFLKALKS